MRRVQGLVLVGLLITGCGAQDRDQTDRQLDRQLDIPTCASVWVAGQELPSNYAGCSFIVGQAKNFQTPNQVACTDGTVVTTYLDYWTRSGQPIAQSSTTDLDVDKDYKRALRTCKAPQ